MHCLVTGAAGFIGYHVSKRLLSAGVNVVGFDNLNDYYSPKLKRARVDQLTKFPNFDFLTGDVADQRDIEAAFRRKVSHVIHLAAQAGVRHSVENPEIYVQSNVVGFLNILEACRSTNVSHLVYASSSSVYGLNQTAPSGPDFVTDHPTSLYAATKKANEVMAHSYSHLYRIPTTGVRFFTVYGPWGRPDMAYFKFVDAILTGKPIEVYNRGELWRDFTYVDDVAESVARLLPLAPDYAPDWDPKKPKTSVSSAPYRIFNVGNHTPVRLIDFVHMLEIALGKKAELIMKPMQPGDVLSTCADSSSLEALIHFAPRTPLKEGLAHFVEWYKEYASALRIAS